MHVHNDELNTLPEDADLPMDLGDSILDTAEKLKTVSDQLKVRLHLAGMEAKELKSDLLDAVEGMSRRLSDYAGSLETTKDTAEVQMHLGLMDARKHWEITKEHVGLALDLIKEDKGKARAFLQEMRLQAQLAKVQTQDAIQHTTEELGDNFRDISRQGSLALQRMNKSVNEFLRSLS